MLELEQQTINICNDRPFYVVILEGYGVYNIGGNIH